ncbi:MAG: tetratricopeptide repeat protein [Acidobacteriota bacterium]
MKRLTTPTTASIIVYRLLVVTLLLICAPQGSSLGIVRTPLQQDPSQNTTKAAAENAFKQGQELRGQGSPASLRKAIEKYEEAVLLFRSIGDRRHESAALYNVGLAYSALGEQQKAIESYNQALTIVKAMGDRDNEATTLHNIGLVYDSLGEKQKALDYYNQALRIRRALGDRRGGAMTLNTIGSLYNSLGERQKALDYYNQALLIARALEDRIGEATILTNIGPVYSAFGEKQKALEFYNQALPILRAAGNRRSEAETLNNIGGLYDSLGEKQKALDYYNQALVIARTVGDRRGEARYLNNIGVLYEYLDENQKALEYYNQALPIRRAVGDRSGEAKTLSNIGTLYNFLGERQKALDYYNQALPIRRAVGDRSGEAATLNHIGSVYGDLGDKRRALDYFNQALQIRRAVGDRGVEAGTLNDIGQVYNALGERQKALDYYNQALPILRAVGDRGGEATTLNNIGQTYDSLGEKQKALDYFNQALPILRAVGDRSGEAATLRNLMALWAARNPSLAVFYLKQAVNVLQQLRANIADLDKELQKTFLRTNESTYRGLADWLIFSGRLPEAQQVLNLFKDQQFFDFNRDMQKPAARLTLTVHEALIAERYEQTTKRIEIVGRQFDELKLKVGERQPSAQQAAQLGQLQAQLKTASDEFLAVLKQAEAEFAQPSAEKDKVGEIADTRELQNALRELSRQTGQKAVAVYILVVEDKLRALLITADNITAALHPIKGDELNQKALQLWGLLQSDKYDPRPLAQELYSIVFKPIEAQLPKDTNTILWSLDGSLRYVPMAALHDGKQYLIERYNHVAFTRADSERLLRAVSPRWTGLGLGSSQAHTVELLGDKITFNALPGVTEELRVLFRQKGSPSGLLDGEVLPDARFTKTTMLAGLKQKRPLVHISSHFSFRPGDEARSFLLLGDGTAMTLEEMKQHTDLFAGVELLTLSACNTAAQQPGANGREIDGFAELAQRLGAGSVMATLWPVADNSTPWLMREFYQTRQNGNGLTKAEAFRRAQLALLNGTAQTKPLPESQKGAPSPVQIVITPNDGKRDSAGTRAAIVYVSEKDAPPFKRDEKKPFAHPYYWAPFILIGNWK